MRRRRSRATWLPCLAEVVGSDVGAASGHEAFGPGRPSHKTSNFTGQLKPMGSGVGAAQAAKLFGPGRPSHKTSESHRMVEADGIDVGAASGREAVRAGTASHKTSEFPGLRIIRDFEFRSGFTGA